MTTSLPVTLRGVDELDAIFAAGGVAALGTVYALHFEPPLGPWFKLAVAGACVLAFFGCRFRCTIDVSGITLRRYVAFVVPFRTTSFLLDEEPYLCDSWESERPEGVGLGEVCFGPLFSVRAQEALLARMQEAISLARKAAPEPPTGLRCRALSGQVHRLDVREWDVHGRPRRALARDPIRAHGMSFPAGTEFRFNETARSPSFRDPRREDVLSSIVCAGPVTLPVGLTVEAGARLWLSHHLRVEAGFSEALFRDGVWVDGAAGLEFDADGGLCDYVLASPLIVDGAIIPAKSRVSILASTSTWTFATIELGAPTICRGRRFAAGMRLHFTSRARPWRRRRPLDVRTFAYSSP
jgi:hypothetical protein